MTSPHDNDPAVDTDATLEDIDSNLTDLAASTDGWGVIIAKTLVQLCRLGVAMIRDELAE